MPSETNSNFPKVVRTGLVGLAGLASLAVAAFLAYKGHPADTWGWFAFIGGVLLYSLA